MIALLACNGPVPSASDFTVEPGAVAPTLVARWTSPEPTVSTLRASFGDETLEFTEEGPTTAHEVLILGVPSVTETTVQRIDDGEISAETSVTSAGLPAWVPDLMYAADVPDESIGGVTLIPIIGDRAGGVIAVDALGRPIWSYPPEDDAAEMIFRARLSSDGQKVLYNGQAHSETEPGRVYRIAIDGSTAEAISITGAHTDFVEYTPGGYITLGSDIREVDGRKILADTLVEYAPDGTERVFWNAWDWFEPDLTMEYPNLYAADHDVEDWTHINGLYYDESDDAIYMTMTFDSGVGKVLRSTGELAWVLSGEGGDFTLDDPGRLQLPHSVHRLEDGNLLIFNRGQMGSPDAYSEAIELEIDENAMTAQEVWSYADPQGLSVPFLGSADRLVNGNTLITWTSAGQLDEVTEDGELAWQVSTPVGAAFGFSARYPRLGP